MVFRKIDNHLGFKAALFGNPASTAQKEALYSLLSLEERNRFLRFDEPQLFGQATGFASGRIPGEYHHRKKTEE
nr:hypothetical protein GCM10020185_74360 [Pseudomonas brassicacearum subsp. brassicacearum]